MCKSKFLFLGCFCISMMLFSCSDDTGDALVDTKESEIDSYFEIDNPDDVTLFESEDNVLNSTPVQGAMDIPPELYGPDLVISNITTTLPSNTTPCSPDPMREANCNTFYTVTFDVMNIGNVNAPAGHFGGLYNTITGSLTKRTVFTTLAPGQSTTLTVGPFNICNGPVLPTNEQFIGFADTDDDIDETREDNNRSRPYRFCLN